MKMNQTNNQINKITNKASLIAVSILCALAAGQVSASTPDTSNDSEINLVSVVNQSDEATLQKAALEQAASFRTMPAHLREQGVSITASQEEQFNKIASLMEQDAQKPNLKARMLQELSSSTHVVKKASLIPLEALGYSGSVAVSALVLPVVAVADFASAIVSGKGAFGDDSTFPGFIAGYTVSLFSLYYSWVTVAVALEGEFAPIILGPMGIEAVDQIVCQKHNPSEQLEKFCATNQKILVTLMGGSARLATEAGAYIHSVTIAPIGRELGIRPKAPKPNDCSATCVLYASNGVTEVSRSPIVSDNFGDLMKVCSDESRATDDWKPFTIVNSSCPN
jgi:hypothetical protein